MIKIGLRSLTREKRATELSRITEPIPTSFYDALIEELLEGTSVFYQLAQLQPTAAMNILQSIIDSLIKKTSTEWYT